MKQNFWNECQDLPFPSELVFVNIFGFPTKLSFHWAFRKFPLSKVLRVSEAGNYVYFNEDFLLFYYFNFTMFQAGRIAINPLGLEFNSLFKVFGNFLTARIFHSCFVILPEFPANFSFVF